MAAPVYVMRDPLETYKASKVHANGKLSFDITLGEIFGLLDRFLTQRGRPIISPFRRGVAEVDPLPALSV